MPFATQREAKRFFIERIAAQAKREGAPLSSDEEWMLSFSESDPDFDGDYDRAGAFDASVPASEYEAKIAGLALRAYQADFAADRSAYAEYKEAFNVLSQGDHYILIMLEQGLGWSPTPPPRSAPWWAFWR
jgi:hypothetical protein